FDASVEGEIGCMGATEGEEFTSDQMKTNPQQALRFAQETGIDALAVSYGSSHGNYPEGYVPEFDFERLKEIKELMPHCKETQWNPQAVDIIPATGGKQNGIHEVLKYYSIDQSETMSFGDGKNDIDMFDYTEISVAMGNAGDDVKKAADYVTDDIDEDGLYNALKHFEII
ncbi:MAG: HAD hydrolase family protein, partial [Catenibacterium mitsuokai]